MLSKEYKQQKRLKLFNLIIEKGLSFEQEPDKKTKPRPQDTYFEHMHHVDPNMMDHVKEIEYKTHFKERFFQS